MARARATPIVLDNDQIKTLTKISRAKSEELRRVQLAKIILMAASGASDLTIAQTVGLNKNSVRNTIAKFTSMGIQAALADLARSGRPVVIGADDKAWVKSQASIRPQDFGYAPELWTISKLTKHIQVNCKLSDHEVLTNIAPSKVWSILNEDEITPNSVRYYLKRRDL
jgi:transposase